MKTDKLLHFLLGIIIFFVIREFSTPLFAFVSTSVIGVIKELYDYFTGKGSCELEDFSWTFTGGVISFIYINIIELIKLNF